MKKERMYHRVGRRQRMLMMAAGSRISSLLRPSINSGVQPKYFRIKKKLKTTKNLMHKRFIGKNKLKKSDRAYGINRRKIVGTTKTEKKRS